MQNEHSLALLNVLMDYLADTNRLKVVLCRHEKLSQEIQRRLQSAGRNCVQIDVITERLTSRNNWNKSETTRWLKSKRGRNRVLRYAETQGVDIIVSNVRFSPCIHIDVSEAENMDSDYLGELIVSGPLS